MLIDDPDLRKDHVDWALHTESTYSRRAMLTSAQSIEQLATTAADYDHDPFLLTVGNGTLDLTTGELRDFRPGDLITRATDVVYSESAECPRWLRFLDEIFAGDRQLINFVWRSDLQGCSGEPGRTHSACHYALAGPPAVKGAKLGGRRAGNRTRTFVSSNTPRTVSKCYSSAR